MRRKVVNVYFSCHVFMWVLRGIKKSEPYHRVNTINMKFFEDADNSLDFKSQDKTSNNLKTSTTPFQIFWY